MTILEESPHRLVIEEKPVVLRALSLVLIVVFVGLAAFFQPIFTRISTEPVADAGANGWLIAQILIGAAAIIPLGILIFVLKTRRVSFDRSANLVVMERVGMLGRKATEYPMASFSGAGLQYSYDSSSGRTSRAVLEFTDGHGAVPLRPYYQSGGAASRVAIKINEWFLGHEAAAARSL